MSNSHVTIIGNLTQAPQVKFTKTTHKPVTRLRIASSRSRRAETGEGWENFDTVFIDVDCWDQLALNAINSLNVGDRILAEGRLRLDEWVDGEGRKQTKIKIVADSVGPDLRFTTTEFGRKPKSAPAREAGGRGLDSGEGKQQGNGAGPEPAFPTDEDPAEFDDGAGVDGDGGDGGVDGGGVDGGVDRNGGDGGGDHNDAGSGDGRGPEGTRADREPALVGAGVGAGGAAGEAAAGSGEGSGVDGEPPF